MINALSALVVVLFGVFFFKSLIGDKGDYKAKMEAAKRKAAEHKARTAEKARAEHRTREKVGAEDMAQCAVCEAYVPANAASNCGKDGCPY